MRVVIFKESGVLVGQCLDHDICTSARDLDELRSRLGGLVEIEMAEVGTSIPPAPKMFHDMWENAGLGERQELLGPEFEAAIFDDLENLYED